MVVVRGHETREASSRREGGRAAEWKHVVAAHHAGDWPPPDWLAVVDEASPAGVSEG